MAARDSRFVISATVRSAKSPEARSQPIRLTDRFSWAGDVTAVPLHFCVGGFQVIDCAVKTLIKGSNGRIETSGPYRVELDPGPAVTAFASIEQAVFHFRLGLLYIAIQ